MNPKIKTVALIILTVALALGCFYGGNIFGFSTGYQTGYTEGFEKGVNVVSEIVETASGVKVHVTKLPNGTYQFSVELPDGKLVVDVSYHLWARQFRPYIYLSPSEKAVADNTPLDGKHWRYWRDIDQDSVKDFPTEYSFLVSESYHAMTLTDFGKNWIADKISGASSTNFMRNATWIGCSNASDSVSTSWTVLPSEITTDGLARAEGTVTDTGTGTWTVVKSFSVTGTNSTKLYGLYLGDYSSYKNTLVAAEQQGTSNQKNVNNGDTLEITITGSV